LRCNELQLVLDGEYLSRTFYLSMSLGDGAIIYFCICAFSKKKISVYKIGDNIGYSPSGKLNSYLINRRVYTGILADISHSYAW